MSFLKDDGELIAAPLQPQKPFDLPIEGSLIQRSVLSVYNRVGGLMEILAQRTQLEPAAMIAVWYVESGGVPFVPKRAVMRLEVHQLYDLWGKRNRNVFDAHFRFGGHNGRGGNPWQNQEYRSQDTGSFHAVHHNQSSEYAALTLAQIIAGDETAFSCASIGGCQVMMNSFRALGYESAKQMYTAFQTSETFHVLTFLDFCSVKAAPKTADLLAYLRARDWTNFAKYYNGKGQFVIYAAKLREAYEIAAGALKLPEAA